MSTVKPLSSDALAWRCDPADFKFETTNDVEDIEGVLGQARAVSAVEFGIGIRRDGYNVYVLGPPGQGKRTVVERFLSERAASEPVPDDWCYVHNFEQPQQPRALRLPAGRGAKFRQAMENLVEELLTTLPAALESEEYRTRVQEIRREFEEEQENALAELVSNAEEKSIRLIRTPGGFVMAPVRDGEVIEPAEFEKLTDEEKQAIQRDVEELQPGLESIMRRMPTRHKESREKVRTVTQEVTGYTIGHLLSQVREEYHDLPDVEAYLDEVERDVMENTDRFQPSEEPPLAILGLQSDRGDSLQEYEVNLLVDNSDVKGAPVVFEDHPTYHNLIGRVEHQSSLGTLVTDFSLIRSGTLHRSNGGYLIVEVMQMLQQPYAWQGLARSLKSQHIRMESLGQALSLTSTVELEPEPIPLHVKVILLGDRMLYYLLHQYDPDFAQLFKVAADFNDDIDRSAESCRQYASLIAMQLRREKLSPCDRSAVARILEYCARVAGDSEKISIHMRTLADLLREAHYWAGEAETITAKHVQKAIDQQIYRSERLREQVQEEIKRGTIFVDTDGETVGQVNGLSVLQLSSFAFGKPSRITATARLGKGEVVDIERETELGGSIHSKGVLILSSFLASRYSKDRPLSLSASLVFEQSYGKIDGDSASLAELCTLLSVLANAPIRQSLAVTGSVNQLGQVQPIGGVNEKIEGFFDTCNARGLTGDQGVLIPAANVKHLMLRGDVVAAAEAGKFHVYAVENVDQAISLLTGVEAGEREASGLFPPSTLNHRVEARLAELSTMRERIAKQARESGGDSA